MDGLTINYTQTPTFTTEARIDNTGLSPTRVKHYEYDGQYRVVSIDGPRADTQDLTAIEYFNDGKLKVITNALGHVARYVFDDKMRPTVFTNANGVQTKFRYENDRIISYTKAFGTPLAKTTHFSYNSNGQVSKIILPNARIITDVMSSGGKPTKQTRIIFDSLQKLLNSHSVGAGTEDFGVAPGGRFLPRLLSPKDQAGQRSLDDKRQVISVVDALGGVTTYQYDEYGNVSQVQDARGVITRYTYNGFREVMSEYSSERGEIQYEYDAAGNLIKEIRENNLITKLKYDVLNRVSKVIYRQKGVDKKVHRYSYDNCANGLGRLCKVVSDGTITRYKYNELGDYTKISTKHEGEDKFEITRYTYGKAGRLETLRYPTGLIVRYKYTDDGFVHKVIGRYETGEGRESFVIAKNIKFDPLTHQLGALTFGNGLKTARKYNADNNLSKLIVRQNGEVITKSSYGYDNNGNITAITRSDSRASQQFSYDALNRLTNEAKDDGASVVSYSYDEVGNRISRDNGEKMKSYGYAPDSNRLQQINRQNLAYDDRGNLRMDRNGKRLFAYDVTNRLTAYYKNDSLRASYTYNAFGQRIKKIIHRPLGGNDDYRSLHFAYTPSGQLLSESGKADNKETIFARDFVWLGGKPLAQIKRKVGADGLTRRASIVYLHTDHLNTPRAASNDNGVVVWRWRSDAFGAGKAERDADGDGKNTAIRLRFPGQYYDSESGLHYNHHRDYDPKLGRYIQPDPIGLRGGINRYAYVGSNPVMFVDPSGLLFKNCESIKRGAGIFCEKIKVGVILPVRTGEPLANRGDNILDNLSVVPSVGDPNAPAPEDDGDDGLGVALKKFIKEKSCAALKGQIIVNQQKIEGVKSIVRNLSNINPNEGTFFGTLGGDITMLYRSIGGDIGVYIRGDYSDYGFLVSTSHNFGIDADLGFALYYTNATDLSGFSNVNEAGYSILDLYGSTAGSIDGNYYMGIGVSMLLAPLPFAVNVNSITGTATMGCGSF